MTPDIHPPAEPEPAFPVQGPWCYRNAGLLGEGGMGLVFRAEDLRLKRTVALKFLTRGHPEARRRFLREAELQALVDHPGIAKVYEVGEVEGTPYFAMQYIHGRPLGAYTSREPRVLVGLVAQVARALHEAHRVGLVHRDIKPANIQVEELEDGALRPVLLDFGIARRQEDTALTRAGAVMGTPDYMSPEQAAGEVDLLDRRSDIYSLGATLYYLLAGRPPFLPKEGEPLLSQVMLATPPSLTTLNPDLPRDLDTIVATAMAKEPLRRYDTARAFAEDLERFLAGEPILARRPSPLKRLLRLVRKHRAAAALIAAILLGSAALSGTLLWRARRRVDLAQRLGQEVTALEFRVRVEHLLPAHDLRPGLRDLRARLADLEREATAARGWEAAALLEAAGRARLALGDAVGAARHLERARQLDPGSPALPRALGLAYTELFRTQLLRAQACGAEERQSRIRAARARYGDPARQLLAQVAEGEEDRLLQAGLLGGVEGRTAEGLAALRELRARAPWRVETWRLEADLHLGEAMALRDRGQRDAAEAALRAAEAALTEALRLAPSDPEGPLGLGRAAFLRMILARDRGAEVAADHAAALRWVAQTRALDPEMPEAPALAAQAHGLFAQVAQPRGDTRALREALDAAVAAGEQAVTLDPQGRSTRWVLAEALLWRARFSRWYDWPGVTADLAQGLALLPEDPDPDPQPLALRSAMTMVQAHLAQDRGEDPRPLLDAAEGLSLRATALAPDSAWYAYQLGDLLQQRGRDFEGPRGTGAPTLERARAALLRATTLQPNFAKAHWMLGYAGWSLYAVRLRSGGDAEEAYRDALTALETAGRLVPTDALVPSLRLDILLERLEFALAQGRWEEPAAEDLHRTLEALLALDPTRPESQVRIGQVGLLEGQHWASQGQRPAAARAFARALRALDRALARDPGVYKTWMFKAKVLAAWHRMSPDPARLRATLAACETALRLKPGLEEPAALRRQVLAAAPQARYPISPSAIAMRRTASRSSSGSQAAKPKATAGTARRLAS